LDIKYDIVAVALEKKKRQHGHAFLLAKGRGGGGKKGKKDGLVPKSATGEKAHRKSYTRDMEGGGGGGMVGGGGCWGGAGGVRSPVITPVAPISQGVRLYRATKEEKEKKKQG